MARPTTYSKELVFQICELIATTSQSIKTICKPETMPCAATIFNWLATNKEFLDQYTRAQEMRADMLIEETLEIADDGSNDFMTITKGDQVYEQENKEVTNRSKLRIDTRKWIASKYKPKKYGDRIDVGHEILPGSEIIIKGQKFANNG
jgi:hypothetical protein